MQLSGIATGLLLAITTAQPIFGLSCAQGRTASACLNHQVTLEAQMSRGETILQHPNLLGPGDRGLKQDYTEISENLGQVIVLSQPINCTRVRLKGVLSQVKLGCEPGQGGKCPYSNYVIRVKSFSCLAPAASKQH